MFTLIVLVVPRDVEGSAQKTLNPPVAADIIAVYAVCGLCTG